MLFRGEKARRMLPKDKLLCCTLEGGFGWEEICPFLEKDIPKTRYPKGNAPAQFQALLNKIITPRIKTAALKALGTFLVPMAGIGLWVYMK